jgi:myo-inositol 2-dehydrogenase/D-chiro-inositol 1-dehydrogenase
VRYGIIGTGAMGREHIQNLRVIDGATVTAICDPFENSLDQAAALIPNELARFNDHNALLNSGLVDAVILATPNFTHVDILEDALKTDLHIFIEKPLCTTVEDCLKVIGWAKNRTGLVWMGLEYRYMPPVAEAIEMAHLGKVGTIHQVAIREHREPFYRKVGDWNRFAAKTGGTLVEKCCHYFNLMDEILQERPQRVFASGGQRVNFLDEVYEGNRSDMLDSAYVIVEYPSGARAMLDLCMFAENSIDKEHLTIIGAEGKIESFLPSLEFRYGKRADLGAHDTWGTNASERNGVIVKRVYDPTIKYPGFHYGASFIEHKKFFKAMQTGEQSEVTLEDGLRSVATGVAAHQSIELGRPVLMTEVLPEGWM